MVKRKLVHTRKITSHSFEREDGLWDIEAYMTDEKTYDMPSRERGNIPAGEPLHGIGIKVTVDPEGLIHKAEATMDYTPFNFCKTIAPVFSGLEGTRFGRGWHKKVIEQFGGVRGCTHIVELLRTVSTVAYQSMAPLRHFPEKLNKKPAHIDGCHALKSDGPVVKWLHPEYYEEKK